MRLNQLQYFVMVAQSGSIRSAAQRTGVAQPSVTKGLQQLEEELGAVLFERSSRGMILTPMGVAFRRRAESVLQELRRSREELKQMQGMADGQVAFGASTVATFAMVPNVIRQFRGRFPDTRIRIVSGGFAVTVPQLQSGHLDFSVGPRPDLSIGEEFDVETLFANTRMIVCRKGHPLAHVTTVKELIDQQWILTSPSGSIDREMDQLFASEGLDAPSSIIQCEASVTILTLLLSGDMVALLPRQWIESKPFGRDVTAIPIKRVFEAPDICLITRKSKPLTPASQVMADLFRRAAKSATNV